MVALQEEREIITERPEWAKYVVAWCEKEHKSLASVARRADISESTFSKMLSGKWKAQPDYLAKIEKGMGIKPGTLQNLNKQKGSKKE